MHVVLDGDFCFSEAPWLSWRDIKYGLEHGFLSATGVVEFAVNSLVAESSAELYELACLSGNDFEEIQRCLDSLEAKNLGDVEYLEEVWIFLILLWIFMNRETYKDPLGVLEELYADFDYPQIMTRLIRYMPAADNFLEGEEQLFKNWSNMLDSFREKLQAARSR